MTGLALSDITGHLAENLPQTLADVVGRLDELLGLFPQGDAAGGAGKYWRINYSGNGSVSSYGDGDPEVAAGKQSIVKAGLTWKYTRGQIRVSRQAIEQAADNASLIGDIVQLEVEGLAKDIRHDLVTQMMSDGTGNGGKDLTGIQAAIATGNTYALLERAAAYTWWQSSVAAQAGGSLTEADIQLRLDDLRSSPRSANPRLAICGPTVFRIIANLLSANVRPTYMAASDVNSGIRYAGGVEVLTYDGIPIMRINGYTSGVLHILDMDGWSYDFIRRFLVDGPTLDADSHVFGVSVGSQLFCKYANKQGAITSIT